METLYAQIKQAFAHPFTLPDSMADKHISCIYIFNSGDITQNAKDDLVARMKREHYGENVFFMAGDRLQDLNRWVGYQDDRNLRARLTGLKSQIAYNRDVWEAVHRYAESGGKIPADVRGAMMHGIELYLSEPFLQEIMHPLLVSNLWQLGKIIDSILSLSISSSPDWNSRHMPLLKDSCEQAITKAYLLEECVDEALERVKPL